MIISTETVLIRQMQFRNEFVICWLSSFKAVCDIRDISLVKEILINLQILLHILMVCQFAYSKKKKENHLVVLLFAIMACMTVFSLMKFLFESLVRCFLHSS